MNAQDILNDACQSLDDMNHAEKGFSPAQQDAITNAIEKYQKQNKNEQLLRAAFDILRQISMVGGTLSDESHQTKTGPNDAVQRGYMYTEARRLANQFLFENKQELAQFTYFQPTSNEVVS